jgi:hypothetical protein
MDRVVLVMGSILGLGPLLVAAVVTRPRPDSVREVVYLALPLVGAGVVVGLAWWRL